MKVFFDPKEYFEPLRVRDDAFWKLCVVSLVAFVGVDALFIAISSVRDFAHMPKNAWHMSVDGGYAEQWQYVKWAVVAFLCALMSLRCRSKTYAAWAAIFLYLLLDDSFEIHERLGSGLASLLGFKGFLGLRPVDSGELLVTGVAAILLIGFLAFSYFNESDIGGRKFTHDMLLLLLALVFFGVFVDMLDIVLPWRRTLNLVEDGGEMIVASAMAAYVMLVWLRSQARFQSISHER